MTEQIIEIEADTLEQAREQVKSQIPEGLCLLSEAVVSDGRSGTVNAFADTTEEAYAKAQTEIPIQADVLEKTELAAPERKVITVEAFDEQGAASSARWEARREFGKTAIVKSVKLITMGRKGLFGIGKTPNQYEAELLQPATVEVTYKMKAKISIKVGSIVDSLIVRLGDPNVDARVDAVDKLIQIGEPAVEPLIGALGDSSSEKRRFSAAEALGKIKDSRALDALVDTLQDTSPQVRIEAAIALGEIRDPKAVKPLVRVLGDPEVHVIQYAADALGQIGDPSAVKGLLDALSRRPRLRNLYEALAKIGAPGIRPFSARLRDSDEETRMWTAYQLKNIASSFPGVFQDPDVMSGLVNTLQDSSPSVRSEAVRALGYIKDSGTAGTIARLLDDPDDDVRTGAEQALANIGAAAIKPILADIPSERYMRAAVSVLKNVGQAAVDPLIAELGQENLDARFMAIVALGEIGDARAVEPLTAALQDEDSHIRYAAVEALGKLQGKSSVDSIIASLSDEDRKVRKIALQTLGEVGDARAVEALIEVLEDRDYRRDAASALGKIGDARAVEPLVRMLRECDQGAQLSATWALGQIGDARAAEPLADLLDSDSSTSIPAAMALGRLGDPRAVKLLIGVTKSAIRGDSAVEALGIVLERNPGGIANDELQVLTNLSGVMSYGGERVDCSKVRQLARQELDRRGSAE
jgi:HEAT repeat protein